MIRTAYRALPLESNLNFSIYPTLTAAFSTLERLLRNNKCIVSFSPYNLSIIKNISYLWTGRNSLKISVLLSPKNFHHLRLIRFKRATTYVTFHDSKFIFYIVFCMKTQCSILLLNCFLSSIGEESTCRDIVGEIIKERIWFSLINVEISFFLLQYINLVKTKIKGNNQSSM